MSETCPLVLNVVTYDMKVQLRVFGFLVKNEI